MECDACRPLLGPYVDGELGPASHLEVEAHLRTCAGCARAAEDLRAGRSLLQALPRRAAPAALVRRLRSGGPARSVRPAAGIGRLIALTGSLAAALAVGFVAGTVRTGRDRLAEEAVADHVRSLQAGHLTDVVSTDQHTVKPWFAGKIDFSPPVVDLASAGFPLIGGRLEQIDHRTAAAVVYRRRQHAINLFIWPADDATVAGRRSVRDGYNLESWTESGLNFLAVSEIPADELDQFVQDVRRAPH